MRRVSLNDAADGMTGRQVHGMYSFTRDRVYSTTRPRTNIHVWAPNGRLACVVGEYDWNRTFKQPPFRVLYALNTGTAVERERILEQLRELDIRR